MAMDYIQLEPPKTESRLHQTLQSPSYPIIPFRYPFVFNSIQVETLKDQLINSNYLFGLDSELRLNSFGPKVMEVFVGWIDWFQLALKLKEYIHQKNYSFSKFIGPPP